MDLNSLRDTVSNLTLYDLKAGVRKVQNAVMNYTEMEAKVREATNNEPWGASSTLMQEIANGTFNYQTLNEIMPMIYRRFTEKSAEEWRQIYKSLQLLEFLIKHGSERVIDDARGHITLLKMLRQFHFIDANGKDQGVNVRNRAKELAELLGDVERIRAERKKARATKNKYTGVEGGGGFSSGSSGRYGGFGSETGGAGGNAGYGGYSGGVYGDGGGFGGQSDDWRETQAHSEKFEEYDEFDEADSKPSRARRTERAGTSSSASSKKPEPPPKKKKEPEVDLFSFDDPVPASVPAPAAAAPSSFGGLAAPVAADDDDDFDDFQSAAPATAVPTQSFTSPLPSAPVLTASASTTAQFAAPKPQSAPQQANLSHMVTMSSISPPPAVSPATGSANYSAFGAPMAAAPAQQPKPSGYQPSGPNYFQSVTSTGASSGMSSFASAGPTTSVGASNSGAGMAALKPVTSSLGAASKPAAAGGGDAFGALWSTASTGIKKTSTPMGGPAMGQLAKEKSAAGIWGAPAAGSTSSGAPMGGASGTSGGSSAFDLI